MTCFTYPKKGLIDTHCGHVRYTVIFARADRYDKTLEKDAQGF
jgi:hypothetical protein